MTANDLRVLFDGSCLVDVRILNACHRQGVQTVADLCANSQGDLLGWRHLGTASVARIRSVLAECGMALRGEAQTVLAITAESARVFVGAYDANIWRRGVSEDKRRSQRVDCALAARSIRDQLAAQLGIPSVDEIVRREHAGGGS